MKAINKFFILAAVALMTYALTACGGGSSSSSNQAGGTTGVTTGAITGFGSVIVNGIEFDRKTGLADDKINLKFEGLQNQREDQLKTGMMVKVTGTYNSSTGRGEYEAIEFQPELRGRLDDNGVDLTTNQLTVMGHQVQIDANTQFDSARDLAELAADLGNLNHPEIEVSGNLDNTGMLHATRIAKKSLDFTNGGTVEIKGAVAGTPAPTANSFTIGTTAFIVDNNTTFANMLRADLVNTVGTVLEVKATLNAGVFTALRVEQKKAIEGQPNDNVRIKGIAASTVSNQTFTLNGPNGLITVNVAGASYFSGRTAATSAIVAVGAQLEVEGSLAASGAIVATKVEIEQEKNLKLEGDAAANAFNAANSTLTLNGVTVNIVATTRLRDAASNPPVALSLAGIVAGNHLQITGFVTSSGAFQASEVQRTKAPQNPLTLVQGPVSAKTSTTMTILGLTIDTATITQATDFVDSSSGTDVPGSGTLAQAQADFLAKITAGTSVVKAKGSISGTTMSASEVEIERPF
jgi:hypothetical protein